MQTIPMLSSDLIEALDKSEPMRTPKPDDSLKRIMFLAGRRSLIDDLIAKLQRTKKIDLSLKEVKIK